MKSREEINKDKQEHLEDIERQEKIKKNFILFLKVFCVAFVVIMFNTIYTKYISTLGIIVKEKAITSSALPQDFSGTKVVQFSDLHYGSTIFLDEVKNLVKIINERKPDIIVFTGDLIDENYEIDIKEQEKLTKELAKLDASIGKYAVSGEEDKDVFTAVLNQCNFTILDNSSDLIYADDGSTISMVGISNTKSDQNIENAFLNTNTLNYTITLVHEPDSADKILEKHHPNLILSGHSHNGQIRIPYLPIIFKKDGALKYPDEHYTLNDTELYVSSGIGCSDFNFRIGSRPSINFFRLRTK